MDFFDICEKPNKDGSVEIYAEWKVGRFKDLMVRGRSFYAIWDEEQNIWSTDDYDVPRLVDKELFAYLDKKTDGRRYSVRELSSFNNNAWSQFRNFLTQLADNHKQLDDDLTFADTNITRQDYVSRRLPYSLEEGDCPAWDELVGTLYNAEERAKIEWAIGAILAGDSKKIQKFMVLYGPAGTGKSTILNIIEKLFEGYTAPFEAKALGSSSNSFSMEPFRSNPLVAIQHDGDLSKIEDNTKLNSIISHEDMLLNEKFKSVYRVKLNAFLFMGTNQPVKISDSKSGIIRRLIDVHPSGNKIPINHYYALMGRVDFELGRIAQHCLNVYREMGKNYYNNYIPLEMILKTNVFFNFIEAYYDEFKSSEYVTLKRAYTLYKEYCSEAGIDRPLPMYQVRSELDNYFETFHVRARVDNHLVRSVYSGFKASKFKSESKTDKTFSLVMDETTSLLDRELGFFPAQYAKEDGTPEKRWSSVKTILVDIDTTKLHYVKVPENMVVIDFDLKDEHGQKSIERNLSEASQWPPTYAEFSKSGAGVHLHYYYSGDVDSLDRSFAEGIEVKVFRGNSSLRRKLTKCNNVPILTLSGGLPLKEKKMLEFKTIKSEQGLRSLIERNMRKEIHPGTKPSIDFIYHILEGAYESDYAYDLSDMRPALTSFAMNSTNHSDYCLKVVDKMRFKSAVESPPWEGKKDDRLVFFDIEVYPNLFIVCWKYEGDDTVVRMVNPKADEVEALLGMKLVGFNNRRYDNHILYAAYMYYNNEQLYKLSKKIIDGDRNAYFGEGYNLSYADVYDFSTKKQGLKKFQIELGIKHEEIDLPWDQPVLEEFWPKVADYCANDVVATEAVFNARKGDFVARKILADISGLPVNETTQKHTARIIFGTDRNAKDSFVYTDLSKEFPGYVFEGGKSSYRNENPGEGGYVYAEPGMYQDVCVLDVASMHPTSIIELNLFGKYTKNFKALVDARLAIKHNDFNAAKKFFNGKLAPYLTEEGAKDLSYALKIAINIVYGLTSAHFDNPFRDTRNKDNIVAKRGALFMIDLKNYVQTLGYQVVHIKTDSIKIPNATEEIIQEVMTFGRQYGYEFELEGTYDKFCLVNDAVYIARKGNHWDAVGAQFQHPFVFKELFTGEETTFEDLCETRSVTQGAMYLDYDGVMQFVGRSGSFVPVKEPYGGILYRVKDDKKYAVTGTKGYRWMESSLYENSYDIEIDVDYFYKLVDEAQKTIEKFGSYVEFAK